MFRKRALQELTDVAGSNDTTETGKETEGSQDPKVATVNRIQDLLSEVGVDPGEDPVEAARDFLAQVDTKLPSSFSAFRFGRKNADRGAADEDSTREDLAAADSAPMEIANPQGSAEPIAAALESLADAPAPVDATPEAVEAEFWGAPDTVEATLVDDAPAWVDDTDFAPFEAAPAWPAPAQPVAAVEVAEVVEPMAVDDEVVEIVEPMAVDDEAPAVPVAESFGEFAPWDAPPAPEPVTDVPVAAASNDELVAAQARIEELQSAVMERAKQRDEMREQLEHAEGRIRQLEGEVSAAQARTDELEQAQPEAAVLGDLAVLEFRGELAPTFGELVAAVAQLEASLAIGEQEKLDARNRITQQEANISELIAQRNEAFGELNVARAHEQELEVELAKLRDELASATDDAGTADDRKAELTRLHAEVDRAEARLRAARTNEQSARDQVEHRRTELGEVQEHLTAARDALRIATSECEATERRLSTARAQAAEAEHARDAARVEAERVIELSMRQAKSLRADAERQAEAARILNDAAREALSLQSDVQQQSQVIRERAEEAAGALRAEVAEHVEDAVEGAPMAPAILSALISRVASIESHLSHQRDRGVEQATPAPVAVAAGTED